MVLLWIGWRYSTDRRYLIALRISTIVATSNRKKFDRLESVCRGLFFVVHVPNVYITSFFFELPPLFISQVLKEYDDKKTFLQNTFLRKEPNT